MYVVLLTFLLGNSSYSQHTDCHSYCDSILMQKVFDSVDHVPEVSVVNFNYIEEAISQSSVIDFNFSNLVAVFIIDTIGNTLMVDLFCDEESVNKEFKNYKNELLLNLKTVRWTPATCAGQKVIYRMKIPIHICFNEE